MSRKLNTIEQAQLRAMIARASREAILEIVNPKQPEPCKCNLCGEPLGFDAWVDSKGELLAGPHDDSRCLTETCKNNR